MLQPHLFKPHIYIVLYIAFLLAAILQTFNPHWATLTADGGPFSFGPLGYLSPASNRSIEAFAKSPVFCARSACDGMATMLERIFVLLIVVGCLVANALALLILNAVRPKSYRRVVFAVINCAGVALGVAVLLYFRFGVVTTLRRSYEVQLGYCFYVQAALAVLMAAGNCVC